MEKVYIPETMSYDEAMSQIFKAALKAPKDMTCGDLVKNYVIFESASYENSFKKYVENLNV